LEKELPKFTSILQNPDSAEIPSDISAQLILMFQATDKLETQDDLSNFMTYVKRIQSSEMQAVFFTMMVRHKQGVKLARGNKEMTKWASDNHILF